MISLPPLLSFICHLNILCFKGTFLMCLREMGVLLDLWCTIPVFSPLSKYIIQRRTLVIGLVLVIGSIVLFKKNRVLFMAKPVSCIYFWGWAYMWKIGMCSMIDTLGKNDFTKIEVLIKYCPAHSYIPTLAAHHPHCNQLLNVFTKHAMIIYMSPFA